MVEHYHYVAFVLVVECLYFHWMLSTCRYLQVPKIDRCNVEKLCLYFIGKSFWGIGARSIFFFLKIFGNGRSQFTVIHRPLLKAYDFQLTDVGPRPSFWISGIISRKLIILHGRQQHIILHWSLITRYVCAYECVYHDIQLWK